MWASVAHLSMVLTCLTLWDAEPSRELLGRVAQLLPELLERSVLAESSPESFFKPLCSILLVRRCRVRTKATLGWGLWRDWGRARASSFAVLAALAVTVPSSLRTVTV